MANPELPDLVSFFSYCLANPREQSIRVDGNRHPWDPTALHASDLGAALPPAADGRVEGCLRQVKLRMQGAAGRVCGTGEHLMLYKAAVIHLLLAEWLESRLHEMYQEWKVEAVEDAITDEGTGRLDVSLRHASGFLLIVDFKSVRGRAFEYGEFPYLGHKIQVQAYMRAKQADVGLILYTDREGQNGQRQCVIERDDAAVLAAWRVLQNVKADPELPPVLAPKAARKKTKTLGEAVTLGLPWNCEWCPFADISCPTALPAGQRGRVAGHVPEGADLEPLLARMLAAGSLHPEGETA